MITDEQLDQYRVGGQRVRVIRDALEMNDVVGLVVAWDDQSVMIRKANKRVVKIGRDYQFQLASEERLS